MSFLHAHVLKDSRVAKAIPILAAVTMLSAMAVSPAAASSPVGGVSATGAASRAITVSPSTEISMGSGYIPVTTSTGVKVDLSINVSTNGSSTSQPEMEVGLSTAPCVTGAECPPEELHSWMFYLPHTDFSYSDSAGTAQLSTGASIDPLGSVSLSFTSKKNTNETCTSGSELAQTGTVSGTIYFSTGGTATTPWGILKATSGPLSIKGTAAGVYYINDCQTAPPKTKIYPCHNGGFFYSPLGATTKVSFEGLLDISQNWGGSWLIASGERQVYLTAPAGSYRLDETFDFLPYPAYLPQYKLVAITTGGKMSKGLITGGGFLILRGKSTTFKQERCRAGKKLKTEYYTEYTDSVWADGATPLTGKSAIGGNLTVGSTSEAGEAGVYSYH